MAIEQRGLPPGVGLSKRPWSLYVHGSTIFDGNTLTVLRLLPPSSVRCVVSSPPYWGLRDYGIEEQIALQKKAPTARVVRDAAEKHISDQWPILEKRTVS